MGANQFDRILGFAGLILGLIGVGVWLSAEVTGYEEYGLPGGTFAWTAFGILVMSVIGAIVITVRHRAAHSGGKGKRWVGWGCGLAILCALLMAGPGAEPLYTDGNWDRFITNDFPAALPVMMAGLAVTCCGFGLLRDLRAPARKNPLRPLTGDI